MKKINEINYIVRYFLAFLKMIVLGLAILEMIVLELVSLGLVTVGRWFPRVGILQKWSSWAWSF